MISEELTASQKRNKLWELCDSISRKFIEKGYYVATIECAEYFFAVKFNMNGNLTSWRQLSWDAPKELGIDSRIANKDALKEKLFAILIYADYTKPFTLKIKIENCNGCFVLVDKMYAGLDS